MEWIQLQIAVIYLEDLFWFCFEVAEIQSCDVKLQNDKCPVCCRRSSGVKVVLGAHSLSAAEDTKQTFDVDAVYNHPDFTISNYDNDIALLKVHAVIQSCSWKSICVCVCECVWVGIFIFVLFLGQGQTFYLFSLWFCYEQCENDCKFGLSFWANLI